MGEDFVTLQSQNGQNMFVIVVVDPSQLKAALHQIPQQAAAYSKIKFYEDEDSSEEGGNFLIYLVFVKRFLYQKGIRILETKHLVSLVYSLP